MLRLIGTAELSATELFTISSANPNAEGWATDGHRVSAQFAPDRNGLPQLVSREDALCAFDLAEYAKKRVVPLRLIFTAQSKAISGINGANLDFGAITSKWSAPTYANRPGYSTIVSVSLSAVPIDTALTASLNIGEALQTALVSNGLYMTLRGAGAMYPAGSAQGTASARLLPVSLEADIYETLPEAQNVWPNAGYAPPGVEIAVTWTFYAEHGASETPKQAAYELEYRALRNDGTERTDTIFGASAKHASIPAEATADAEAIWYRLRVQSDDGVWGEWTEEIRLSTIPLSRQCEGVSPVGRYLSEGEDVLFVWRHASEEGLPQARARLHACVGGGAYFLLADLNQRAQSAVLRFPGGLESGELRWYAVTTDEQGAESLPSEPIANILLAAPAAPVIERIADEARPAVVWRENNAQSAYRLRVFDSAGELRFDSGMLSGTEREARCEEYLAPGLYAFEITVWNEYGLSNASRMDAEITVPCLTPVAPVLSCIEGGVRIEAEPPGGQYAAEYEAIEIFRDGLRIARLSREDAPYFEDFRAHGVCGYVCRLIAGGADALFPEQYGDSEPSVITPCIDYPLLAAAANPGAFLRLDMLRGSAPIRRFDYAPAVSRLLAGRRPVAEHGGGKNQGAPRKHEMSCSLCEAAEFSALRTMAESGEALLYRDEDEKFYCACTRFTYERTPEGWDFTLGLAEVGFDEELRIENAA